MPNRRIRDTAQFERFNATTQLNMAVTKTTTRNGNVEALIEVQLCIPEEQERFVPKRRRAPQFLPLTCPIPRKGEVIYLAQASPWAVSLVVHQWRGPTYLRVEVWLEHLGTMGRPAGFALTQ